MPKKALMVIAFKDFRDVEYFVPKEILEKEGVSIKTASNKEGMAIGADGGQVKVDFEISQINPDDFDVVIFVGGPGCLKNLDNENSYELIRKTIDKGKILAAICIAPVILAKAGVLRGKKATVWTSTFDKTGEKILKENGADYLKENVVTDGKIITASGPAVAENFGKEILKILK